MPPEGSDQLTDKEKESILKWIKDGGLETYTPDATDIDFSGYKARIQFKGDATVMTEWQTLPQFVDKMTILSLGKLKAGSNLVANISVVGPSGAEILNETFKFVIPESGKIMRPLQANAETQTIQQPAVVPVVIPTPPATPAQPPITPAQPPITPVQPPITPSQPQVVDVAYPDCPTGPMSPEGLEKWRNKAAAETAQAANNQGGLIKISRGISVCFPDGIPSCLQRTYEFGAKKDVAPSGELDLETEAKKLPGEFLAPSVDGKPRYTIKPNIEAIAKENGWLTVRYKSRHAGGFDRKSSNLLMIYVPGDKVSPPVTFDRWINIAFDPDAFENAFVPAPVATPELNLTQENTFTLVSLDRNTKPATVYFQMFSRVLGTDTFETGNPAMSGGLDFCATCHPNGLRAISPLGYHVRENQRNFWGANVGIVSAGLKNLMAALPPLEARLPDEDWQAVKKMNDAMDTGEAVSWGEGLNASENKIKPLYFPNGYGPVVGPLSPLNGKSRTEDFIKSCFNSRKVVHVEDVFQRDSGTSPNSLAILSTNAISKINWEKVSKAMQCASCHDGVNRGSLNSNTNWTQIDFKILVDQSMPANQHSSNKLNDDERLALANCLMVEYKLEEPYLKAWLEEKTCKP